MSKETEPIRSRRELREQSARAAGAGANPTVPASDAAPRGERESQTRARDRAALRAYKELIDPPAMNPLPSRRALRQAQLDADRAPITALNPVLTAAAIAAAKAGPGASVPGIPDAPAAAPAAAPSKPAQPAKNESAKNESATDEPATTANSSAPAPATAENSGAEPATTTPASADTALPRRPRSGRRAATAAVPMVHSQPAAAPVARPDSPVAPATSQPAPPAAVKPAPAAPAATPSAAPAATPSAAPAAASPATPPLEQSDSDSSPAETAHPNYPPMPGLVPGGSYYPVTAGPPAPAATPSEEELQALAAKKAEAERAAILSQRAEARERLAQESAKSKRQTSDPTATNNLAMVTPLEFIDVPGSDRPVMRPPTTTHVPIVTRATPKQSPQRPRPTPAGSAANSQGPSSGKQAPGNTGPRAKAERFDAALAPRAAHRPGPGNRPLTGGHSGTLKKAEAMATGGLPSIAEVSQQLEGDRTAVVPPKSAAEVQRSQMPPMPADYAHGLEPLDAMTAGLGRTQRNQLIQWGSVLVGAIALIVGAIMFFSS